MIEIIIWCSFLLLIAAFIGVDLGVFHRRPHAIRMKEAMAWTVVWIAAALLFNVVVYLLYTHRWMVPPASTPTYPSDMRVVVETGRAVRPESTLPHPGWEAALQFLTAYLVEKSLSVDNIFVIAVIFAFFRVPVSLQHRVLFWGILGAVVLRGIMIAAGTMLIHYLTWATYVFGVLLLYSAYKMAFLSEEGVAPDRNRLVLLARKFFPVVSHYEGTRFFVRRNGRLAMTPLFLALLVVESSDVMFAVDSIPAVLAITHDPFIVFTSNVFAILGLRSLYFAVAALMEYFEKLKHSLVVLLAYIGVKMLVSHQFPIPTQVSLLIITGILVGGILWSLISRRRKKGTDSQEPVTPKAEPSSSATSEKKVLTSR